MIERHFCAFIIKGTCILSVIASHSDSSSMLTSDLAFREVKDGDAREHQAEVMTR